MNDKKEEENDEKAEENADKKAKLGARLFSVIPWSRVSMGLNSKGKQIFLNQKQKAEKKNPKSALF